MSTTPVTYKQLRVHKRSFNFREATEIVEASLPSELPVDHVVIKTHFVGLQASDVNLCSGNYGNTIPIVAGFEAMGEIVQVGSAVTTFKIGSAAYLWTVGGAFSEYIVVPATVVYPLPGFDPAYLTCFVSGTTASIAYENLGELKLGQTALVTSAAGGTGQFAVQLAKLAGMHVVGTCGSDEKFTYLKSIGCDRVINYKKEDIRAVLRKEYPKGIDLVYECVGGKTMEAAIDNIAVNGKILIIGAIHSYLSGVFEKPDPSARPTDVKLLFKSASLRGFFLGNHFDQMGPHAKRLIELYDRGILKVQVDLKFKGLEHIADAVEYLYEGKNAGKVIVDLRK